MGFRNYDLGITTFRHYDLFLDTYVLRLDTKNIKMKVLIVDDEPIAQELLEKFCARLPDLEVLPSVDNAVDALPIIAQQQPDLVLLDIKMPEMTGLEMLRVLRNSPSLFIITTAYSQHALEGYELDVVDYLLKPIPFPRFVQAVSKARDVHQLLQKKDSQVEVLKAKSDEERTYMWVKEGKKLVQVCVDDIVLVRALKDYMELLMPNDKVIVHITMTKLQEYLQPPAFLRVNRSCIVRKTAIRSIQDLHIETILPKEGRIAISSGYWEEVKGHFKEWF